MQVSSRFSWEGRHVIIVEDIVDTGRTLQKLRDHALELGAASVAAAALLDKVARRTVDVAVEYIGFVCPDEFTVGCAPRIGTCLVSICASTVGETGRASNFEIASSHESCMSSSDMWWHCALCTSLHVKNAAAAQVRYGLRREIPDAAVRGQSEARDL